MSYPPGSSIDQIVGYAVLKWRPTANRMTSGTWHRRDEPAWHDPAKILKLLSDTGASNEPFVQSALSLGSRVYLDLPVFRNFFAHRNGQTFVAAQVVAHQYSIPSTVHPADILVAIPARRTQELVLDWIDDIALTVECMVG